MGEGSRFETLEDAGYVHFFAAGEPAAGEFTCADCGYGVAVQRTLPLCPMCGSSAWEESASSPFHRRRGPLL